MKNVAGIFDSRAEANRAVSELNDAGFRQDEISLLISDKARGSMFGTMNDNRDRDEAGDSAAKGGLTGAVLGGTIGALVAGLTAVGSIVVPGAGLLVAGPIVAALSGAGAGAAAGGLSGALIGAGFSDDEAGRYEKEIKAGKAVIVVHPDDENRANAARRVLQASGASKTKAA